jgi:hypothetical protein
VKELSLNLKANVRLSFIHTVQAIRHSKSALDIINNLLPSDPIREQYYQEAISNLTLAYDGIVSLPLNIQFPTDPILPTDPIHPSDPIQIIRLSNIRAQLSLNMTNDALKYIEEAISLTQESDDPASLYALLTGISFDLGFARSSLMLALDIPTLQ